MPILISGSMAYDYIMDFPDNFKNHILPDQLHILNVCFIVDQLKKNLGGCAGNIAYTMKLLEAEPIIFAPLGMDGEEYKQFLTQKHISTQYITQSSKKLTSGAHITTDKDHNQIIAYYNGAGDEAVEMSVHDVRETLELAIIAPTKKEAMIKHAKECREKKIPIVFDPSHQLTAFSAQELMLLMGESKFYVANDYEIKLTEQKTGWSVEQMLDHTEIIITTLGEQGSTIRTKNEIWSIAPCPVFSVQDPTGAGDAYRAGFFTAYSKGLDLKTCGQVGSVAAAYCVEHYGTQNHHFTLDEFRERYEKTYGERLNLSILRNNLV